MNYNSSWLSPSFDVLGGINVGKPVNGENWKDDKVSRAIPVARIADCLLNPGAKLQYNGREITYPEIDMIYWVGGNPITHQQNVKDEKNRYCKNWRFQKDRKMKEIR